MSQVGGAASREFVLEARGVGRRVTQGDTWLLRDLSLSIATGERVALTGPSGSGKTVLLRTLALLDPIDAGTILWHGEPISREATPHYRSRAIYLHQRPALVEGSVLYNLRQPFQYAIHRDRNFELDKIRHWLELLGRDAEFLKKESRELSGGEMQITALLRAMQLEPELLFLDEPTAALDPPTTEAVEQCLLRWQAEQKEDRSFVMVSHNPQQVNRMVDRVLQMRDCQLLPSQQETS